MSYRVVFSPETEDQLDGLHRYLARAAGREVADGYIDAVIAFCEGLAVFPGRGRLRDDIRLGLRTISYRKRTVVAFVVRDETVAVVGIFHGGRDYESILAEPDDLV